MPVHFIAAPGCREQNRLDPVLASVDKTGELDSAARQAIALYNLRVNIRGHYVFLDKFALGHQAAPST